MIGLSGSNTSDTILIVSCIYKKLWDYIPNAPDVVPDKHNFGQPLSPVL